EGKPIKDLGCFTPQTSVEAFVLTLRANDRFVLTIDCSSVYSAHTIWVLENARVDMTPQKLALDIAMQELISRAISVEPGEADSHELFVLTCASRFPMALRNVASHLLCACRKPKRVLVLSFDDL